MGDKMHSDKVNPGDIETLSVTSIQIGNDEPTPPDVYDYKVTVPGEPKSQERHRMVIMPRRDVGVVVNFPVLAGGVGTGDHANYLLGKDGRSAWFGQRERGILVENGCTLYRKKDLWLKPYDPSYQDKIDFLRLSKANGPQVPLVGPLRVDVFLYFEYRKGDMGTGKNAGKVKASAAKWKDTGKDRDNCDKFVLDALTGDKGFWVNDSQVADGRIVKVYSTRPRTEVYITKLSNAKGAKQHEHKSIQQDEGKDQLF